MTRTEHRRAARAQRTDRNRLRIAQEAARLISEHGIRDHRQAIFKATAHFGITGTSSVPDADEVEEALRTYQRLFLADSQPRLLRQRREAALASMQFLETFTPRLTGAVLDGTADAHSAVCLQVFCDDADAVGHFLSDSGVPLQTRSRRWRIGHTAPHTSPVLLFDANSISFEVVVLPHSALRQSPWIDGDERPAQRASTARLRRLLAEDNPLPPEGGASLDDPNGE